METLEKVDYLTGYGWMPLPWHQFEHRELAYRREPFNNGSDENVWRSVGYTNEHFTGEMYDMRCATPSWFDIEYYQRVFPWEHLSWSFYKMTPGVILPTHVDTFRRYREMYQPGPGTIRRGLVFLEDWCSGHYLDLGNKVMHAWRAGEYAWWTEDAPHTAANCGMVDRYTLQLTGIYVK